MVTIAAGLEAPSVRAMFAWPRLRVALAVSLIPFLLLVWQWTSGPHSLLIRTTALGLAGLAAFGVLERWPHRLPRWLARWVLQLLGVGLAMPLTMFLFYYLSTEPGAPAFWRDADRLQGFLGLSIIGMMLGWWTGLFALVRQKDVLARQQALALELQRSEFERQALDSRLRLLQAQVAPHFLFNTLANVRELVEARSPQAPRVLDSLIAYLRAAVPQLDAPATTVGHELQLVRAYLEIMHMRMPDRLQFELQADESSLGLRCPPMTLLTLVENAVRHGIDPGEEGGRIDVRVQRQDGRCCAEVRDTGVGLRAAAADAGRGNGLGTGLSTLRERLQLAFGGDAQLRIEALQPHGVCATVQFPAVDARRGRQTSA